MKLGGGGRSKQASEASAEAGNLCNFERPRCKGDVSMSNGSTSMADAAPDVLSDALHTTKEYLPPRRFFTFLFT